MLLRGVVPEPFPSESADVWFCGGAEGEWRGRVGRGLRWWWEVEEEKEGDDVGKGEEHNRGVLLWCTNPAVVV